MPCVYILYSESKDKEYIGSSREDNPNKRLEAHNKGKTRSTKYGRPWKIIYHEIFDNYTEARKRENFLKSGQGRKWFKERC